MKTTTVHAWIAVSALALTMTIFPSWAAQSETPAGHQKTYIGTVKSVDPNERILHVQGPMLSKDFSLGSSCEFVLWDKPAGAINDLRPGEKVMVRYQEVNGVQVADRIEQKMMTEEGTVKAIDPVTHTLALRPSQANQTFQLPDDCKIVLRNDHSGALSDIQPGNHVTVTYEMSNGKPVAREIAQTSATFTGTLTGVDLQNKTLKAKAAFNTKTFKVGDDCAILLNGKTDGQLTDLKPNEKLMFSYDEIKGVNIVNRIATLPAPQTEPTSAQPLYP